MFLFNKFISISIKSHEDQNFKFLKEGALNNFIFCIIRNPLNRQIYIFYYLHNPLFLKAGAICLALCPYQGIIFKASELYKKW